MRKRLGFGVFPVVGVITNNYRGVITNNQREFYHSTVVGVITNNYRGVISNKHREFYHSTIVGVITNNQREFYPYNNVYSSMSILKLLFLLHKQTKWKNMQYIGLNFLQQQY